ncbi:MAG TPA: cytochrome P450 [Blastocatellia bacterium]|nr:cytochrome P450 [Blastocatellia bacterium]
MTRDKFFDPLDPEVLADPYPAYRRLREHNPIYWHQQLSSWVVTKYSHCAYVLDNSDIFANDFRRIGIPTPGPILSLQTLDPPEQTPLRQFATNALHSQDLKKLDLETSRHADELLDNLASRESFDFVRDFADPFTLGTISRLVGVEPSAQDEEWARMNDDLDRSMDSSLVPDSEEAGLDARARFSALVESWLRAGSTDGIVGYIVQHQDEVGVSREILVNSLRAFWHAGFEVPSRFLGNAVATLLKHPGAIDTMHRARTIDSAVNELVRYAGPVHALSRACTRDVQLGDQLIRNGQIVIALIAAGNRDPEQFADPEELRLDRDPNQHLGFGRGAHSCLGAQVARIEARIALSKLAQRFPKMRATAESKQRANATLRGPAFLPMTLGPESGRGVAVSG